MWWWLLSIDKRFFLCVQFFLCMNIFFKYDNKVSGKIQSEKKTHVLCMSATLILATHTSQGYSKGTHTTCFINDKMKGSRKLCFSERGILFTKRGGLVSKDFLKSLVSTVNKCIVSWHVNGGKNHHQVIGMSVLHLWKLFFQSPVTLTSTIMNCVQSRPVFFVRSSFFLPAGFH